ncbi:dynactin subunit 4-like [Paramacrobiotus metropolitanus]|uniref:dynactin subunit 4-like n=1 Tax=Paramacrobiotus metropolitanus TaxID=2943436 RepID=UPI002445C656|nr:dynactin subunit 4-like [Paramacrobiotus metropolitanus]
MSLPIENHLLPQYLQNSGQVIYSDGNQHGSLQWLYFCRFCKHLCDYSNMTCEIEIKRCTSCTETFTSSENSDREMGCPQCFECPLCSQTLVIRATTAPSTSPAKTDGAQSTASEKRYHLVCQCCRWNSRGAGIPDAIRPPSISAPWKFVQEGHVDPAESVVSLSNYYSALSISERDSGVTKTKEKPGRRRLGYNSLSADKYRLVSVAQKRISGVTGVVPDLDVLKQKAPEMKFMESCSEMSENDLLDIGNVKTGENRLSMQQQLRFPGDQPQSKFNLLPKNRPLSCKRTWRCKACQHVLTKNDFSAHSVKFKIISSAPLLVPTIKPCKPNMIVGKLCDFVIPISNPLNHELTMGFSLPNPEEPLPKWITGLLVSNVTLPSSEVTLLSRSYAAGIDEKGKETSKTSADDDSNVIAFRKLYSVGVRCSFIPLSHERDNWLSFNIRYDFRESSPTVFESVKSGDTSANHETSSKQATWIHMRIDMNLGKAEIR